MAKLLTLALVETTRREYQVAAWDLDANMWVLLKDLPINGALVNGQPVWDLFQVTDANIQPDPRETRSNCYMLVPGSTPTPGSTITGKTRLTWLEALSRGQSVDAPRRNNSYVTLVEPDEVLDILMTVNDSYQSNRDFTLDRPFFWESRIEFEHNGLNWSPSSSKVGVACKDLRWKTYWHMIARYRQGDFRRAKDKWLSILQENRTFFVIEYYNNRTYVVSGIHSLSW